MAELRIAIATTRTTHAAAKRNDTLATLDAELRTLGRGLLRRSVSLADATFLMSVAVDLASAELDRWDAFEVADRG